MTGERFFEATEIALARLVNSRPVFHAERDFQLALALELKAQLPAAEVRCEVPFRRPANVYLDILIRCGGSLHGLELKYHTASLSTCVAGEDFILKSQGAQDVRRFDILKDVQRMEDFVDRHESSSASVVVLTNDRLLWSRTRAGTISEAFDLFEGRQISGTMEWASHASEGSRKGRDFPLTLARAYPIAWRDYSDLGTRNGRFQLLHIRIGVD